VAVGLRFDWDRFNAEHMARHGITPAEAEEVLRQEPLTLRQSEVGRERRWVKIGETAAGRVLVVIHTSRMNMIRVVTAYPANRSQRATYRRLRS
jgi:uncharacterized DUF497 family protein